MPRSIPAHEGRRGEDDAEKEEGRERRKRREWYESSRNDGARTKVKGVHKLGGEKVPARSQAVTSDVNKKNNENGGGANVPIAGEDMVCELDVCGLREGVCSAAAALRFENKKSSRTKIFETPDFPGSDVGHRTPRMPEDCRQP